MSKLFKSLKNIHHELNERRYVEFVPSTPICDLPRPRREPLNLQPIETCELPEYYPPSQSLEPPPPPYTEYQELQQVILQIGNSAILFNIGEKNCISYKTCLTIKSIKPIWYTSTTGNDILGQTILNDIPFYISNGNENIIALQYTTSFSNLSTEFCNQLIVGINVGNYIYAIIDLTLQTSTSPMSIAIQEFKIGNEKFSLYFKQGRSDQNFIVLGRDFIEKYVDQIDTSYNTIYLKNGNTLIACKL